MNRATLPFIKMHGAGNDFVVFYAEHLPAGTALPELSRALCHRQLGIGADQVLLLSREGANTPYQMHIYNADGSRAQMCGNGLRCVAHLLRLDGKVQDETFDIMTLAGLRHVRMQPDGIFVNMGRPEFKFSDIPVRLPADVQVAEGNLVPLKVGGEFFSAVCVSMGNPHCVIFTNAALQKRVAELGPQIETHGYFPEKTNVMLASALDEHTIDVAHWERGSGMTLACGSGACATAAAAIRRDVARSPVTVRMRGGDIRLLWDGKRESDLWMSGPVALVYRGEYFLGGAGAV